MSLSNLKCAANSDAVSEFYFHSFAEVELQRPGKLALQEKVIRVDFRPAEEPAATARGAAHGCL